MVVVMLIRGMGLFDNEECLMPLGKAYIHAVRQAMYPQSAPTFFFRVGEHIVFVAVFKDPKIV